jgi:hypothetical protein
MSEGKEMEQGTISCVDFLDIYHNNGLQLISYIACMFKYLTAPF